MTITELTERMLDDCERCSTTTQPLKWWRDGTVFYICRSCAHRWRSWWALAVGHSGRPVELAAPHGEQER